MTGALFFVCLFVCLFVFSVAMRDARSDDNVDFDSFFFRFFSDVGLATTAHLAAGCSSKCHLFLWPSSRRCDLQDQSDFMAARNPQLYDESDLWLLFIFLGSFNFLPKLYYFAPTHCGSRRLVSLFCLFVFFFGFFSFFFYDPRFINSFVIRL